MGLQRFVFDDTTPHSSVAINEDGIASRSGSGTWVTLRSTEPLSPSNRQWAFKVVHQGEGTDGSGLMLGLLPKQHNTTLMSSKYISELGGWCVSRAGESYGSWKCERVPFGTGQVVEFEVDFATKTMYVICGKVRASGSISALQIDSQDYYPACSVYYHGQRVMFV